MKSKSLKSLITSFKEHWNTPPQGRYMPFKEITSLSVGGIGVRFIVYCVSQMIITTTNTLIGNTIGITPSAMYVIYIISLLSGFPLTALRARMIDNTRSMKGKYRPYLIKMGIPTVLLGIGFVWMPYESMSMFAKCTVVLAFNIGFQFFYNFYTDSYDSLINVLSPNSIERSDVLSIRSIVENISPSIASIFLPIVAKLITGGNTLYDLKIYRVLFPPMLIVSFLISIIAYVNTKEKIVQAKTHVVQVKFIDAFRAIARNKYFWIISLAGWIGFLESGFNSIMGWMYNYQQACSAGEYSLITAIAGNACFWPNIVAPFLIRKYGKKKILVASNLMSVAVIASMLPVVRMTGSSHIIWVLLACNFVNSFITSLGHLLSPSINADIRDYQQYISGERIDGMFAAVGLIGNVVTMITGSVLPMLYERSGLNSETAISLGYDGSRVYDVLYNTDYFIKISSVLIVASVIGAFLNVIPYFFYDLTEAKQRAMVKVLKIRAMFEDYGNNVLNNDVLNETVDIIEEAKIYAERPLNVLQEGKTKEEKQYYYQLKSENEKIEEARLVMNELNKYNTPNGIEKLHRANSFVAAGLNGFISIAAMDKRAAKAMPKNTAEEKERRREALTDIQQIKTARKVIAKKFPNGLKEFDSSVFEKLFKAEDENELKLHTELQNLKAANESKDKNLASDIKNKITLLQNEKSDIKAEIKKATDEYSLFYRAAKPYLDAKKTIAQAENYAHYSEIAKLKNK